MTKDIFELIFDSDFAGLDNINKVDVLTDICKNICRELGVSNYPEVNISNIGSSGSASEGKIALDSKLFENIETFYRYGNSNRHKQPDILYAREKLCLILIHECIHQLQFQTKGKYEKCAENPASNSVLYFFQNTETDAYIGSFDIFKEFGGNFKLCAEKEFKDIIEKEIRILNNLYENEFINFKLENYNPGDKFILPHQIFTSEQAKEFDRFFNEYFEDIIKRNEIAKIAENKINFCKNFEKFKFNNVDIFSVETDGVINCVINKNNTHLRIQIKDDKLTVFDIRSDLEIFPSNKEKERLSKEIFKGKHDYFISLSKKNCNDLKELIKIVNNIKDYYNIDSKSVEFSDFIFQFDKKERSAFINGCKEVLEYTSPDQSLFKEKFLNSKIAGNILNVLCYPEDKNYNKLIDGCNEYINFCKENNLSKIKINKAIFLRDKLSKPEKRYELIKFLDKKYRLKEYLLNKGIKPNLIENFNIKNINKFKINNSKINSKTDLDNIILLYKQESLHDILYQKPEIDNKAASR